MGLILQIGKVCLLLCLTIIKAHDLFEGDVCKSVQGTQWTCKQLKDCKKGIESLKSGGQPEICSFKKSEPVVCCEPEIKLDTGKLKETTTVPSSPTTGLKAKEMCKIYARYVFQNISAPGIEDSFQTVDTCTPLDSLIVGGKDANAKEFPHMALIGYEEGSKIAWRCGGSLISQNYVLSAAHCTQASPTIQAKWVLVGEYNTKSKQDEFTGFAQPQMHKISERINHPNYKPPSNENDIALYKLATNVEFNEYVRPICLQTDTIIQKRYSVATGWGNTVAGGKPSDVLQKVNLTLVSQMECSKTYNNIRDSNALPNGIREDSMICAGGGSSDKDKDTCQGDSGGPLQLKHPALHCMYSQIGITSFGWGCGVAPGVYTRVSYFVPWIEGIVWK